jgi:D-lactate dehydrogenase (cytochrome)
MKAAGLAALEAAFGTAYSSAAAVRRHHAATEGLFSTDMPDAVVALSTTADVARAMALCAQHRLPVIPYGAGSSVKGQLVAVSGGVSFDLCGMNRVLAVRSADMDVTVEAGVTRRTLNQHLRDAGVFFPVDPGADASLGGMAATSATGTTTVRYGGMRENVLGLTVVLPSGEIIRTGGRARKSSAGYDLTRLMIGSEGTLGIITELTLRVHPIPEQTLAAVCPFSTLEGAVAAVIEALQCGVDVARIELLDALQMRAVNAHGKTAYPEAATLFLEFHGTAAGVADHAATMAAIATANGGGAFEQALRAEDRTRMWDARHRAYFAALALCPGKVGVVTDVCVPISALADNLLAARHDIDAAGLTGPVLGHVGDGNFHAILLVDPADDEETTRAKAVAAQMVERSLASGGTCTGEHGIGLGKKAFLRAEAGDGAVAMMRAIKSAVDPHGLMNPGKVFDCSASC